ncbi:MAG: hypothetical protein WCI55_02110 [Armatimonadota bacterium]
MSLIRIKLLSAVVIGCSLFGCNAGMAPTGASPEDVKVAFDKLPLEERVKLTNGSSMPAEDKKKKIAEMYQKEGKAPPEDGGTPAGSAPTGPPEGMGTPSQGGR